MPTDGAFARRHHPYGRLLPLAGVAGLPFGLVVGGRPCMRAGRPSSLLSLLRKRTSEALNLAFSASSISMALV
ncbi:hypothetical protein B296_00019223 [Ensete ventricosum]|uniref:Uncharacterized protein n=1 Tax=Ensete ventricosum TaxID=4639 RepID=A0A426X1U5_ENSVE|nr:hypothetical protein B296_00019223 [Ensete ventricosum]